MEQQQVSREQLDALAREFRYVVTDAICRSGSGHIGGVMSLVEIVITLYYRVMRVRPEDPSWPERDRLVLSKGHAGPIVYTALAYKGFFPKAWLATVNQNGTRLPSHMDQILTPGVEMTAGSLGQGLSAACGMALAAKLDGKRHRVFCIIGDGESDEGQIWEAAMFAAKYQLDNLTAILDYNGVQQTGTTAHVMPTDPIAEKWRSFGWYVIEIHAHNVRQILEALDMATDIHARPCIIIARGTKGKGVSFMEYNNVWHGKAPNEAEYMAARAELERGLAEWQH